MSTLTGQADDDEYVDDEDTAGQDMASRNKGDTRPPQNDIFHPERETTTLTGVLAKHVSPAAQSAGAPDGHGR